ncbi:hypothetical protein BDY24DRAFT_396809 [Mrakia frigida]|uniref:Mpv17/PMP22 family protein n=1 Tax=Mrakia frigida TaxID=29902 RepID=UPI003FCBFC6D
MVWIHYNRILSRHPYLTRSVVAAGMMASGDILSQRLIERNEKHDVERSARFFAYGFFVQAPVLAQWFKLVDRIQFKSSAWAVGTKVVLDQTIWGPLSCIMFYGFMSLLEGHTLQEAKDKVAVAFWPTYIRGGLVFLPTSFLTYSIIPRHHRGLFLQGVGLGWNTYLSGANSSANGQVIVIEAEEYLLDQQERQHLPPSFLPPSRNLSVPQPSS